MAGKTRNVIDRIALHFRQDFPIPGQNHGAFGPQIELSARLRIRDRPAGIRFANSRIHRKARSFGIRSGEYPHRILQIRRFSVVFERIPAAKRRHQRRSLDIHDVQNLVDDVRAQVRHLAARIIPEPAEVINPPMRGVGLLLRRTKPHVVIKTRGRFRNRQSCQNRDRYFGRKTIGWNGFFPALRFRSPSWNQ